LPEFNEEEVISFMKKYNFLTLATSREDKPSISTVAYANDGLEIYFEAEEGTEKTQNIKANPNVALLIGGAYPVSDKMERMLKRIQLQYEGKAEVVKDAFEIKYADDILRTKFPIYQKTCYSDPLSLGFEVIKITPKRLRYLDERGRETILEFS
jgi:general stress protein 26